MLFNFKREVTSRTYDVAGSGFSSLPVKIPAIPISNDQIVQSNVGAIRNLLALFSAIFSASLAYGILMVMIALKVEEHIKNEILISISSATQIIAGIIFSRFLPILGRKIGLINTIYCGAILSAICSLLLYFYSNYILWILVIYLYGTSLFICGVTRQTVMIDLAPKHMRALVISIGSMIVAIGNSLGPILLDLIKTEDSFLTFAIACSLFLLSLLPLNSLRASTTNIREEKKIGIWRYIKNSPKIMFAGFAVNYVISATNAFLIIYGIKIGMPKNQAALLISVLLLGSIFSVPLGYLVDILNRRFLMIFSSFLSLICVSILYFIDDSQKIYTMLFITFGCLIGMKLSSVVLINDKYKPTQRLAVNSAFSRVSLCGNIIGLIATGIFMKCCGAKGLWLSSMFILVAFLIFCGINYLRKFQKKEIDFSNLSILHKKTDDELLDI